MFDANVISSRRPKNTIGRVGVNIIFSKEYALNTNPHDNDPLVIIIQHDNWDITCALINLGSSTDVLLWDVFQNLKLNLGHIQRFTGSFMGLSCERMQIMSCVTLETTCGQGHDVKTINVNYLILNTMSPYNIILRHPVINALGAIVSTRYLTLKYPFLDGRVDTIQGDQQVACESYMSNLETTREELILVDVHPFKVPNACLEGWDPRLCAEPELLTPIEDLKEV